MNVSNTGIKLIQSFEGCKLTAYKDAVGVWTIGWGHTAGVHEGMKITQAQADKMLNDEVQAFATGVAKLLKVNVNQNQFDTLVSFAYNVGIGALQKSTLLELVNEKKFSDAAKEFDKWTKAGGKVLAGLVNRRNAEQALFLKPMPVLTKPQVKPQPKFTSLIDYLMAHNMATDFHSRSFLAASRGIHNYTGTADQNIQLLNILQK